uniref:Myosin motor domain-containing protein n=1 Tax=Chromera velia CCMP2878 TaxID=1169474 RepID=A0A0G4GR33_9ALVE|eukprot:Cvel_22959.t1-p1 / transcript=Cvel_22959.t1 / gene=Cvel_22959 / organism=Chromera_velia_CCMP2878 / gene_product=Myosin-11, putative / transcript_product=Myosin-11, putative / location=Cvel_scaffold2313:7969-17315(+) / protein_length=1841 / sequence_SO=supercontig / SO=protein_coding / is_pseudo=false
MASSDKYAVGTLVFVADEEMVWKPAEIIAVAGKEITVRTEGDQEERQVNSEKEPLYLRSAEIFSAEGLVGLDDLTQLMHLHEAALLDSLNTRFDVDKIYTFTGPILIAVNPFKTIPGLYEFDTLKSFISPKVSKTPHVFATANAAYRALCDTTRSQTVLISGESGAGKTESTKFVMKFLASAGTPDATSHSTVEKQVLESNPLLEAFGNARTLRNDNSSRFGKFIELQFKTEKDSEGLVNGRVCGARIQTYLLEKVRVVDQQEGERNFHIFYQLTAAFARGCKIEGGKRLFTTPAGDTLDLTAYNSFDVFKYLTKSSCSELDGVDDVEQFSRTVGAMSTVGISAEEQQSIFRVVAAVLFLGNVNFEAPPGNSEASEVVDSCAPFLKSAAQILEVDTQALAEVLTIRTIRTRGEVFKKALLVHEADETRDALARALYGTLFLRVVQRTNQSIGYLKEVKLNCGVLDIFGFECFQYNSFEQLCINFTNERLQQFFNTFVFKCEEELYCKEKIPWDPLDFPDNQDCVDMLQDKPHGIFPMLDEECIVPQGSDRSFCSKLLKQHSAHKRFDPVKTKPTWFTVNHFAGPVKYCSDGFLDKNKDQLLQDVQECVKKSSFTYVADLFSELLNRGGGAGAAPADPRVTKKKSNTVSSEFKEQLSELMTAVGATDPHFIRCIKPNPQNLPDEFDRKSVTEQLRYGGVLQAVQVSRAGYPVRVAHTEAFDDYCVLAEKPVRTGLRKVAAPKDRAQKLLETLTLSLPIPKLEDDPRRLEGQRGKGNTWAVGETLCFFKQEAFEVLNTKRLMLRNKCATKIQARWKAVVGRRQFLEMMRNVRKCQAVARGALARLRVRNIRKRKAAVRLQSYARMRRDRKRFLRFRKAVCSLQAKWRWKQFRRAFAQIFQQRKAAAIQALYRGRKQKVYFEKLKKAVRMAQNKWRSILARRQLRRLRQEQKEAGALLSKVQELQTELQKHKKEASEAEARSFYVQAEVDKKDSLIASLRKEIEQLKKSLEDAETQRVEMESHLEEALKQQTKTEKEKEEAVKAAAVVAQAAPAAATPTSREVEAHVMEALQQAREEGQRAETRANTLAQEKENIEKDFNRLAEEHEALKGQYQTLLEGARLQQRQQGSIDLRRDSSAASVEKDQPPTTPAAAKPEKPSEPTPAPTPKVAAADTPKPSDAPVDRPADGAETTRQRRSAPHVHDGKPYDIVVLGIEGSGKTSMLEQFCTSMGNEEGPKKLRRAKEEDAPHVLIPVPFQGKELRVLKCSGKKQYYAFVRDQLARAKWVFAVYQPSMDNQEIFAFLEKVLRDAMAAGCRILVIGNTWHVQRGQEWKVDLISVKDLAARHRCYAVETASFSDALFMVWETFTAPVPQPAQPAVQPIRHPARNVAPQEHRPRPTDTPAAGEPSGEAEERKGGIMNIGAMAQTLQTWFGKSPAAGQGREREREREGLSQNVLLRPSLKGTESMRTQAGGKPRKEADWQDLRCVQEVTESESAVTCLCFGQERHHLHYYLMACASKDGNIVIYRIYRTEMERAQMSKDDLDQIQSVSSGQSSKWDTAPPSEHSLVAIHSRLIGHSRAVTSIFFSLLEDQLVTTSIDKSVRFWSVDSGEMQKVFTDSSPALVAAFLPFNPKVFVAANSNAVLRLVNVENGIVHQKLKVDAEVRALKFDDTGLFCMAGTKTGNIHVLEASDNANLKFKFRLTVARGAITCITFVPSQDPGRNPMLLVNSCDSIVSIVDCMYGPAPGVLSSLQVQHRVKVAHSLLPLRCCYSGFGGGYLISASEDKEVYVYALRKEMHYKSAYLGHHRAPVLAVATNVSDSLLVSADSMGSIAMWRRFDFSHLL